ncbi:MAG TPA: M48 family metallopeptidase [Candidatus Obscuribacterales bacterium]
MTKRNSSSFQAHPATDNPRRYLLSDRFALEVYQAFMIGYVRRINEATLNVTIGGVRIGQAKYSRLAQINLQSRIITFSRFAIENVPERGRRYLVIHELAHVKEPSHNQRFWDLVARYEPNYRQIGRALELAFKRNVREHELAQHPVRVANPISGRLEQPKLLLSTLLPTPAGDDSRQQSEADNIIIVPDHDWDAPGDGVYICQENEFGLVPDFESGIIYGGSALDLTLPANA